MVPFGAGIDYLRIQLLDVPLGAMAPHRAHGGFHHHGGIAIAWEADGSKLNQPRGWQRSILAAQAAPC